MCSVKNLGIRKYPCDFVPCPSKKAARLKLRRTNQTTGVDEFLLLSWQMCCRPSTAKKGKVAAPAFVSHIGFDFRQLCPPSKKRKTPNSGKDSISSPLFFVKIPQSERDGEDTVPYKRKCYAVHICFGVVQPTLSKV